MNVKVHVLFHRMRPAAAAAETLAHRTAVAAGNMATEIHEQHGTRTGKEEHIRACMYQNLDQIKIVMAGGQIP